MTIVAVIGDCTTTTCVALASAWSITDDVIVLESDPSGGSLAGWLDTPASPSLATIVAASGAGTHDSGTFVDTVLAMTHLSAAGIRFVAAPVRSLPAHRAIAESAIVVSTLAASDVVVLADCGRTRASDPLPDAAAAADVVLVVHRQETASAAASVVRLERLVETLEQASTTPAPIVLAIIGTSPFDPDEIVRFVDAAVPGRLSRSVGLADDALSAAVIAGRTGVSAKRLHRLPLLRDAGTAALCLRDLMPVSRSDGPLGVPSP